LRTAERKKVARYAELAKQLREAPDWFDERERRIFSARWHTASPLSLNELADEFGISRKRVQQIEARAHFKARYQMLVEPEQVATLPLSSVMRH
jgi:RNA polymerase sigma factor (sigma-70 family)